VRDVILIRLIVTLRNFSTTWILWLSDRLNGENTDIYNKLVSHSPSSPTMGWCLVTWTVEVGIRDLIHINL